MEPTPAEPVKKRRRWRTIAAVAVLMLGLGWWFWPRVDQRLVGTWELNNDSHGLIGFRLFADGSVEIASNLKWVSDGSLPRPWKVEGEILFISQQPTDYDGLWERIELQLRSTWERFLSPSEAFSRSRIVEVTANSLTLEDLDQPGPDSVSKYHRLPDGAKIDMGSMRMMIPWDTESTADSSDASR